METPTKEPLSLYCGDTALWRVSPPSFPADQGWRLSYVFNGPQKIEIQAQADGSAHLVEVVPGDTAQWLAGEYSWISRASQDDKAFTVATGFIEIMADPTAVDQTDARPWCKRVLDSIEAVIEGRATHDEQETEYKGRKLVRIPPLELMAMRKELAAEWRRYQDRLSGRKSQTIKVRFS